MIRNALGKVWNGIVAVGNAYERVVMFPWRAVRKLYKWTYDD